MTLSVTGMAQMSSTEVADLLRSRGIPEEAVDALVMRSVNGSAIIAMDRHALQQFGVLAGAAQSQILRELQSITGLTLEEREQLMSRSARSKSAFSVVSDSPSNSSDSLDESAFPEAAEWKHRGRSNTCVLADNDDLAATSGTSVLMPYGNMPKTNTLLGLQPERTGTLLKKELFGWKKRFLLLKGDLLFWLKERTDSKPAGRIWLLDPSTVVTPKSELELSITVHQKTHSFRARNISSMKEWTKAIQRAKEYSFCWMLLLLSSVQSGRVVSLTTQVSSGLGATQAQSDGRGRCLGCHLAQLPIPDGQQGDASQEEGEEETQEKVRHGQAVCGRRCRIVRERSEIATARTRTGAT
ncbi:MAG: hypothetical protein MHM6MM_005747 [Cercozoa sp. M6MM]